MKKNKGFTLIELLAVIVILAIIALIATPIMIGVIENARRKAFEDSGYGIVEATRQYYVDKLSLEGKVGNNSFTFPNNELKYTGTKPAGGDVKLYADGTIELAIHNNRWCATKDRSEDVITTIDYIEGECEIKAPFLMKEFLSRNNKGITKEQISSIEIVDSRNVPEGVYDSWDASLGNNKTVMAWVKEDGNGLYKLYLGGSGGVIAPVDSSSLFRGDTNYFENLTNLNISY